MNQHTLQGIAAAKSGRKDLARQFLGTAVQMDERDIAAWWWLARVIDDPKASHKCLEKARAAAAEGEEGSRIYQGLLRESGSAKPAPLSTGGEIQVGGRSMSHLLGEHGRRRRGHRLPDMPSR